MYGLKITPKIEQQLPVLLEYVRIMPNVDYIPSEIASASTILYAIQEKMIERSGDKFTLLGGN